MQLSARVKVGDNRQTIKELSDQSVQMVVTSPPYFGLRDYGVEEQIGLESTPQEFIEELCLVFDEVWRVLKDDGTIWVNLGDSYAGSGKGSPVNFGKHAPSGRARHLEHKHSGIVPEGLKPKDLIGIPWRFAFAMQERGWYLRSDIIWHKPNPMPESVTDRPTKSHEYIFLFTKSPKYFYDHKAIFEPTSHPEKVGQKQKVDYRSDHVLAYGNGSDSVVVRSDIRNKRSVWSVTTSRYKEAHFATYPPELITPCILAGSKEGDVVLDPFSGSGTTGEVALQHGRNYIGLELNADYAKLSEHRLNEAVGMFGVVSVE